MTTNVDGIDQLRDSLAQLVDWLDDPADLYDDAANTVAGHIHPPVRTGRLAHSVHAVREAGGGLVLAGGATAPYGAIVNARDHFMDDGLTASENDVTTVAFEHVQQHVNDLKGA